MKAMGRTLRTLAAVLAGVALVAALPAPCGCAPERSASPHADEHACCVPPAGVSAADDGCCDEAPDLAEALLSPAASADAAPRAVATRPVAAPSVLQAPGRPTVPLAASPPPTILRI
jgi:hypothetical protein